MPGSADPRTPPERTIRVPSDLGRLADVRAFLRAAADDVGAGDACTADLVQAVDEAATNAIIHGHAGKPGWVEVDVATEGDRFIVTLRDDAPAFDPTVIPSPDLSVHPGERRPGGMGVMLARLCVDEMSYAPRPGGGNILTLVRRFERNGKEDR
jgi:anti-sigma regulatory factor (Ser/Thr protein kinase)